MCRHEYLSAEEAIAAEESLTVYCKPVEFYNIIQRRALRNPYFLRRCLHYKIEAKHEKRIRMTISLSEAVDTGIQVRNFLPLYVLLVRPVPDIAAGGHSVVYCLTRARNLTASSEFERRDRHEASFTLPEINKLLAETESSKFTILMVSCGERKTSFSERNAMKGHVGTTPFPSHVGGYCLWGEIPMESLFVSSEKRVNLSSVRGSEMLSTVDMRSCFLEPSCLDVGNYVSPKIPENAVTMQVQVRVFAQELGAKATPYDSYTYKNVPTALLPHIMRLRSSNVHFNYKYYNNTLQKTEVTEDFSCPFCLVKCASFKGLRYHLCASHDLFNYEFWVTEEYQAVNVSVKSDTWKPVADDFDARLESLYLCSKPRKRRTSKNPLQNSKHVHLHVVRADSLEVAGECFLEGLLEREDGASSIPMPSIRSPLNTKPSTQISLQKYENGDHPSKERDKASKICLRENDLQKKRHAESNGIEDPFDEEGMEHVASSPNVAGAFMIASQSAMGLECFQRESGSNLVPLAKSRKLSTDRSDPKNRVLLQKRQFFHSHRAQPMAMEQVMSDRDSEDEVDDEIADFEDRRMLDDFVDVTKDEKRVMHIWNSFVRKQRVLADGHVPWTCEAISRLHSHDFVQSPELMRCWRLFMIKLWNHSLLDAHTMDNCNKIFIKFEQESLNPKQNLGQIPSKSGRK